MISWQKYEQIQTMWNMMLSTIWACDTQKYLICIYTKYMQSFSANIKFQIDHMQCSDWKLYRVWSCCRSQSKVVITGFSASLKHEFYLIPPEALMDIFHISGFKLQNNDRQQCWFHLGTVYCMKFDNEIYKKYIRFWTHKSHSISCK